MTKDEKETLLCVVRKIKYYTSLKRAVFSHNDDTDKFIDSLEYNENEYHDEIVTVTFRNGCQKQVNVTADSIMAITYDIYRCIV